MELSQNFPILKWAEEDRPREKLLLKGRQVLSDAELIGILIGSGTRSLSAVDLAKQILHSVQYDLNRLARLSVKDLQNFKGIGEAKAISIVSALELGRRRKQTDAVKQQKITCSGDAFEQFKPHLLDLQHEEFRILLLNRANIVLHQQAISNGGVSGTVVDPKIIFKTALQHLACAIIMAHNHPSGNLKPSEADLRLTKKIKTAGELLEIPVLDHLICADHQYLSFADEGLM